MFSSSVTCVSCGDFHELAAVSREENKDQTEADFILTVFSIRFLIRKEALNHVGKPNNTSTQYFERIKSKFKNLMGHSIGKGRELFLSGGKEERPTNHIFACLFIHIIGMREGSTKS